MNKEDIEKIQDIDEDEILSCGCQIHYFHFGMIVEPVVIEECGKNECEYKRKLRYNK